MNLATREVDIEAYDHFGRAVLLAEVTSIKDTSEVWASQFRRNILSHGTLPSCRFFLIATPDLMCFWRHDGTAPDDAPPQFTIDAARELKPYFEEFRLSPERIGREAFQILVFTWLNDIVAFGTSRANQDSTLLLLSESGLLGELKGARILLSAGK